MTYSLEPDDAATRAMGRAATDFLADFIAARATAPAVDFDGATELVASFSAAPPEEGQPLDGLLDHLGGAAAKAFDTAGPGYLAFIPGGGLYAAAVADFLACGINRFVNLAAPAPALVAMEASVLRWLCDLFGLPSESQGILTSGGSMANLSATVTARLAMLPDDFLNGTLYVSDQGHHSVAKAAQLAGFPPDSVRIVPSTDDLRIDVEALVDLVESDRAAGSTPFLLVANAGTTNTGVVDPMIELARVAEEQDLWLHVDAAYGGFFQLTERGRATLGGVERADSITLDPHKGMFLPYGTGCLLVREGDRLRRAHHVGADYLQDLEDDGGLPNFAEYSPELSRDFRGLRVWLPLHLHGVGAFRAALDEKLDLAAHLHDALAATPGIEVLRPPELSIMAFRAATDEASFELLERVNASGRVFLSSTVVDGRFTLRVCVLCHRTHRDRIDEAIDIITKAVA